MPTIDQQPPMQMTWSFSANDYESARRARRELGSYMKQWRAEEEAVQESALIFGELVGNAVRHVGGHISAQLVLMGSQPVLCVTDHACDAVLEIPEPDPDSETGRGLRIVHALARDVWVQRSSKDKTICAALPCDILLIAKVEKGDVTA